MPSQQVETASRRPVVRIWTIQMGRWRKAQEEGIPVIDITAKSGVLSWAPLFSNVMRYKRGELGEDEYTELYVSRMRQTYRDDPEQWETLTQYPKMALACYCKAGAYCHRLLFADIAKKYLEHKSFTVILEGELQ